jgi:hypothetical protein
MWPVAQWRRAFVEADNFHDLEPDLLTDSPTPKTGEGRP